MTRCRFPAYMLDFPSFNNRISVGILFSVGFSRVVVISGLGLPPRLRVGVVGPERQIDTADLGKLCQFFQIVWPKPQRADPLPEFLYGQILINLKWDERFRTNQVRARLCFDD